MAAQFRIRQAVRLMIIGCAPVLALAQAPQADPITADPMTFDAQSPANLAPVSIPSGGAQMIGRIYLSQGQGPHPTVILLHGFPGNELNLDLAQAIRRAGWNVLAFHYRGAWGSGGDFSFGNALDDVAAALAFVRNADVSRRYRIDPQRVVLVGHSMGAFAALMASAKDPAVRAVAGMATWNPAVPAEVAAQDAPNRAGLQDRLQRSLAPLKGTTGEALAEELVKNAAAWHLARHGEALAGKSVLLVGASRDVVAPAATHHMLVVDAVKAGKPGNFTDVMLESDHSFSDRRIALTRAVVSWLGRQR